LARFRTTTILRPLRTTTFIARFRPQRQGTPETVKKNKDELRNLRNARGFYDRRAALAFGEAGGFFLVGINPAKGFAVGVIDGDQEMMMFSAAIFPEFRLSVTDGLPGAFRWS